MGRTTSGLFDITYVLLFVRLPRRPRETEGARGQGRFAVVEILTHLAWADGLSLYAESLDDLNAMLKDVAMAGV